MTIQVYNIASTKLNRISLSVVVRASNAVLCVWAGGAGGAAGGTSEYVRNELRAVVGARAARPDLPAMHAPDLDPLLTFDMPAPG